MKEQDLQKKVQDVVRQAVALKNKHTMETDIPVNYACIFAQSEQEYQELLSITQKVGKIMKSTSTGFLFQIPPLQTLAGKLQLLKIRIPDSTRPEEGDADFTVTHYPTFKKSMLQKKECKLIPREGFEMIELMDPAFHVRAYFSNPPLDKQFGIK